MKLGTQTGSVMNHLQSRAVIGQPEPQVGMGATILCWTDRKAATITAVIPCGNSVLIRVQEDHATRTDQNGMSECQAYEYQPNPDGAVSTYRRRKNGTWQLVQLNVRTQRWNAVEGNGLRIGDRQHYHDYSF